MQWVFPNVMASINSWKRSQLDDNRIQFEQGGPQEYIHEPLPNTVDGSSVTASDSEKKKDIHVFVCTDESDLRPLAVLINSSMENTP